MNVVFNSINSGLGNNGGTRTILKCSEVLNNLGHRCDVLANVDKFTWFDHRPVIDQLPADLDVMIAVACSDVLPTIRANIDKKAWYIRAHETWAMPEYLLIDYYKNDEFKNLVNSKGLQKQLETFGAKSKVIYQGIDFDWWKDKDYRAKSKIRIGCLHTTQPRKRWKDFKKLSKILGHDHYEYVGIGSNDCKDDFLIEFWHNATAERLNILYNTCHIWFAPTDNEGLHNVPMEAALCGCLVVCSDHPLNGMSADYAFDGQTAMVYEFGDLKQAAELIKNPDWGLVKNMQDHLRTEIGTREENMTKLVEYLEGI
jgi:hypothetical protein